MLKCIKVDLWFDIPFAAINLVGLITWVAMVHWAILSWSNAAYADLSYMVQVFTPDPFREIGHRPNGKRVQVVLLAMEISENVYTTGEQFFMVVVTSKRCFIQIFENLMLYSFIRNFRKLPTDGPFLIFMMYVSKNN